MGVFNFIVLGLLVLGIGYGIVIYNNLVALKHRVAQAWSNICLLYTSPSPRD